MGTEEMRSHYYVLKHEPFTLEGYMGKEFYVKPLARDVLVVASAGFGEWSAYIGAVPGSNHEKEWVRVFEGGSKVEYWLAKTLFPNLVNNEWRD